MTDGKFLYVGLEAKQDGPIAAAQHTNNVGLDTDDEVQIDLWPAGSNGFRYLFIATPLGTHYQFSSENDAYEPNWDSAGKLRAGGFSVTMRIPLNVMRGAKVGSWRVQLARFVQNTHEDLVRNHGPTQGDHNDVTYAGYLTGMPKVITQRPKPRLAVYGLGEVAVARWPNLAQRSGPFDPAYRKLVVLCHGSSRFFQRRGRSANHRANCVSPQGQRSAAVLYAGG